MGIEDNIIFRGDFNTATNAGSLSTDFVRKKVNAKVTEITEKLDDNDESNKLTQTIQASTQILVDRFEEIAGDDKIINGADEWGRIGQAWESFSNNESSNLDTREEITSQSLENLKSRLLKFLEDNTNIAGISKNLKRNTDLLA
jgi:hypothetical protein